MRHIFIAFIALLAPTNGDESKKNETRSEIAVEVLKGKLQERINLGLSTEHPSILEIISLIKEIESDFKKSNSENDLDNNNEKKRLDKVENFKQFGKLIETSAIYVEPKSYKIASYNEEARIELMSILSNLVKEGKVIALYNTKIGSLIICRKPELGLVSHAFDKGRHYYNTDFGSADALYVKHCSEKTELHVPTNRDGTELHAPTK